MPLTIPSPDTCTNKEERREKPAYTITSTGNVLVNVDRLLNDPRAREAAEKARGIVQKERERSNK